MAQQAAQSLGQPLPFSTALLSHVALTLLMWNVALRLAILFYDGLALLVQ